VNVEVGSGVQVREAVGDAVLVWVLVGLGVRERLAVKVGAVTVTVTEGKDKPPQSASRALSRCTWMDELSWILLPTTAPKTLPVPPAVTGTFGAKIRP
jgi:hypothetical protein